MTQPPFDLLITGGTLVTPWGEVEGDLGIRDGRVAALSAPPGAEAERVLDARGLHVLPGLIDSHVHFREPGDAGVETIESGTRGAVLGGIACVCDMPNTSPAVTDRATLDWKRARVEETAWCDVGLYVGAQRGNVGHLADLESRPGVCAVKVFAGSTTGDLLIEDDETIEAVLEAGRRRVAFHAEDEPRLQARRPAFASGGAYRMHPVWRDAETAFLGTRRIVALARRTGRPVHILHVSTAEEAEWLATQRDIATFEVLVNPLVQVGPDAYDRLGGYAVMNPPIRDARHRDALWRAVADGRVETIGSDHAPHPKSAKERPWPATAAGLTGVQTLVPLLLDCVAERRLTLARLVDLLGAGPARVFGIVGKGRLAVGMDGDATLVDLNARRRIETGAMASPCGWTPFDGTWVTGWPMATVVRGQVVMRDGEVQGKPVGRPMRFEGTARAEPETRLAGV